VNVNIPIIISDTFQYTILYETLCIFPGNVLVLVLDNSV